MSERRVVVTGLGATTPLGGTIAETWDGILAGRSGAKPLPPEWLERYELPVHFACTIAQKPEEVLTKVEVRRMDPSAQYAVIASRAAMEDAGSPEIEPPPPQAASAMRDRAASQRFMRQASLSPPGEAMR